MLISVKNLDLRSLPRILLMGSGAQYSTVPLCSTAVNTPLPGLVPGGIHTHLLRFLTNFTWSHDSADLKEKPVELPFTFPTGVPPPPSPAAVFSFTLCWIHSRPHGRGLPGQCGRVGFDLQAPAPTVAVAPLRELPPWIFTQLRVGEPFSSPSECPVQPLDQLGRAASQILFFHTELSAVFSSVFSLPLR